MIGLEELALRVEAAVRPDRGLDVLIGCAVGYVPDKPGCEWARKVHWQYVPVIPSRIGCADKAGNVAAHWEAPAYTASLDAAMTLVPEGYGWLAGWGQTCPGEPMGGARVTRNARFVGYGANYDPVAEGEGATPALALCAAALRARAHLQANPIPDLDSKEVGR